MQTAVFFSLEGSVLRGELQLPFVRWAALRGDLPLSRWGRGALAATYRRISWALAKGDPETEGSMLFRGASVPRINRAAKEFFAARGSGRLRAHARPLVAAHRRCGHITVLVATAAEPVARPLAQALQCDALLATALAVRGNRYSGECRSGPRPNSDKRERVREFCAQRGLELGQSYAYAGYLHDADWLESVGTPIAANPCRALRARAAGSGWRVIDLDSSAPPWRP